MPRKVTAYKCLYCDNVGLDERAVRESEKYCAYNPAMECCENCVHQRVVTTARQGNMSHPVRVCGNPPDGSVQWNDEHQYGWCPNYQRNPAYGRQT